MESHTRLYLTAKNLMRVIELRANQLFVDDAAAQAVINRFMDIFKSLSGRFTDGCDEGYP